MFCWVLLVDGNNNDPGWAGNASITAANGSECLATFCNL